MKTLILLSLLLIQSTAFAFDLSSDWNPPDDANIEISGKTYKQIKALRKTLCEDVMPMVWQRFDNTHYEEACK